MQRLIEQPADDGEVSDGDVRLGRVHYHLSVYQQFSGTGEESVAANLEVEGRITPLDQLDLATLHRGGEFTLILADGRLLEFSMAGEAGAIRSTGRGLYQP